MGALADLNKQTIQCKPKHALTSFKFVKDPRPWYVRKDNPGMARLQATCCPIPDARMCSARKGSCTLQKNGPIVQLSVGMCNRL